MKICDLKILFWVSTFMFDMLAINLDSSIIMIDHHTAGPLVTIKVMQLDTREEVKE